MSDRILVVDDDVPHCLRIAQRLARPDRPVKIAHDGSTALEWVVEGQFALLLLALGLPRVGALEVLDELARRGLPVDVLVLAERVADPRAAEALAQGARGVLAKPVDLERLELVVARALDDRALRFEVAELRRRLAEEFRAPGLVARSEPMREAAARAARLAATSTPALIAGEPGTGKSRLARVLHESSPRRGEPFAVVPCDLRPEPLLASALFDPDAGAWTRAGGGTLVLDAIDELPRALQESVAGRLAAPAARRGGRAAGTRVLATTCADLAAAVSSGTFRAALFDHLARQTIALPPLRCRCPEDLPPLIDQLLQRLERRGLPAKTIAPRALMRLERHDWPGNVRELEDLIERLVLTTPGPAIGPDDLPPPLDADPDQLPLRCDADRPLAEIVAALTEHVERDYLRRALALSQGRVGLCARRCGLSRRSVSEKLKRYGIDRNAFKTKDEG
jgi:DNA-binding NtrC family response regulator